MLEKLTDYLIKRRLKKQKMDVSDTSLPESELKFRRVLNTLRENKVVVFKEEDGIYIRMAGAEPEGFACSSIIAKVYKFK